MCYEILLYFRYGIYLRGNTFFVSYSFSLKYLKITTNKRKVIVVLRREHLKNTNNITLKITFILGFFLNVTLIVRLRNLIRNC